MSFNKNIKTDYGAAGNAQVALTNVSITSGTNALAVSTSIFAVGDIGSTISIAGAGPTSQQLTTTISGFTNATHVTLGATASTTMTAQQMRVYWGTDDTTAFSNWQTDAKAQGTTPCVLTIPAGVYLNPSITTWYAGVFDLTINMAGATISEFSEGGAFAQAAPGTFSARLNQVNAGDTVVSLITPAQTSIFTVGSWVCLSSLELQGLAGYPPNFQYFEYHQIIAIGTGTITIDAPATYTHKTTYPFTGSGSYDTGGPATLFWLTPNWNQTVVINGGPGGVLDCGGQVQVTARSITVNDCTIYGRISYVSGYGLAPSIAKEIIFNNCTPALGVEPDKDITSLTWNNCTVNSIQYQSTSITNVYVNGGTISDMTGGGRSTDMNGCTVTSFIKLGGGYGGTYSFVAANCNFAGIETSNSTQRINLSSATYANGIFTASNGSAGASVLYQMGVPGSIVFWTASGLSDVDYGHQAVITDIWADATNTHVSISPALSAPPQYYPDPDEPGGTFVTLGVIIHPAPRVTFTNCIGCADAIDLSQAGAGQPLYSYTKRTYVSDTIAALSPIFVGPIGKMAFIKITVNQAASGVGPLYAVGQFGLDTLDVNNFWHRNDIIVHIDLSQVGERLITPTAVTGAVGADVISFPEGGWPTGGWIMGGLATFVGAVITGGSVTIEAAAIQAPTDNPPVLYSLNSVW